MITWRRNYAFPHPMDELRFQLLAILATLGVWAYSLHLISFQHAKGLVFVLLMPALALCCSLRGRNLRLALWAYAPLWGWMLSAALIALLFTKAVNSYAVEQIFYWELLLFTATCCYDLVRHPRGRIAYQHALIMGAAGAALLGIGQYFGLLTILFPQYDHYTQPMYSVFGNQDALGGYLAMLLPLAFFVPPGKKRGLWPVLALLAFSLLLTGARSAWFSAGCGLLIAVLASRDRTILRRLIPVVAATLMALLIAWPQTGARFGNFFQESDIGVGIRKWIWAGTARMIQDRPVTGQGIGQFAYHSPRFMGTALAEHAPGDLMHNLQPTHHAHCDPLELYAETGILGIILWSWFLLRRRRYAPGVAGALCAWGIFACFNATLQNFPQMLAVLLLLANGDRRPVARPAPTRQAAYGWAYTSMAAIVALGWLLTVCIPSLLLCRAEQLHVEAQQAPGSEEAQRDAIQQAYERATAYPWPLYPAYLGAGMHQMETGKHDAARALLHKAAGGIDTGTLHHVLAECEEAMQHEDAALEHYQACLHRWPFEERVWQRAVALASGEERAALLRHGRHWGFRLKGNNNLNGQ